jgi:hypothetical protein
VLRSSVSFVLAGAGPSTAGTERAWSRRASLLSALFALALLIGVAVLASFDSPSTLIENLAQPYPTTAPIPAIAPSVTPAPAPSSATKERIAHSYGKLPLSFVPNAGQTDKRVRYSAQGGGFSFFFTNTKAVFAFEQGKRGQALELRFLGANPDTKLVARDRAPPTVNYLTGKQHHTNLPTYERLVYRNLWPGIDMVFRGAGGKLKYEFHLQPGADPNDIRLAYAGAEGLSVGAAGSLLIDTPLGRLRDARPKSHQRIGGQRAPVESRYALTGDRYGFELGHYDGSKPLVIDPGLAYSTYLGGTGVDYGYGIAVDSTGAAYVTGSATPVFPTTAGAFDTSFNSGTSGTKDAFITKLNSAGSSLVYSTYLGGGAEDAGSAIAVDSAGAAYVIGQTRSTNFPTTAGTIDRSANGMFDAFVTKLNPSGASLAYSTYLGGSSEDQGRGIAVDSGGNASVTGYTLSTDFLATPGLNGGADAFVTMLNASGSAVMNSIYLGGSRTEKGLAIAVDSTALYVTGLTNSTNFPVFGGGFDTSANGLTDAFVTKLNLVGPNPGYSTYLGGSLTDQGGGIAVDALGAAYVMGNTSSTNFPTTAGAFDTSANGGKDAFVTKLSPAGSSLGYSTYLGGSGDEPSTTVPDRLGGIALDSDGNAYITGQTTADFPTTPDAFDTFGGLSQAFLTKVNASGSSLVYSTYLGGGTGPVDQDVGYGIAVDSVGNAYVTGNTGNSDFPTTAGAFSTSLNGDADAFITKFDLAPPPEPILTDTDPDSPANDNAPEVKGTAEAGSTVSLYTSSDCSGTPVATGTAAAFASPGITAGVADNSTTTFKAIATDASNNGSPCSTSSITYTETAGFSAAITLSAAGQPADNPQVGVDQNANAVFTWSGRDTSGGCFANLGCYRARARGRSATGVLSAIQTLSPPDQGIGEPQLGVDQDGDAVFDWQRGTGTNCPDPFGNPTACVNVQGRARTAAETLSGTQTLSNSTQLAQNPQVGVDSDGDAVFVWKRLDGTTDCGGLACFRIQGRTRTAGGSLGTILTLSGTGQNASSPEVAVDPAGDAVFVWERGGLIQTRARSAAGTLSATQTLSAAGQAAANPEVAIDQDGDAVFTWQRLDGTTDCDGSACERVEARARKANGNLSATQTLSDPGQHAVSPQVAVNAAGKAVFTWRRSDGADLRIQDRGRTAAGVLSTTQTPSPAGEDASAPEVGIDQDGDAVLVWQRFDGTTGCGGAPGCLRIQARTRATTGSLGAVQTLSGAGQHAFGPQVAVSPLGSAVATWWRSDGTNDRVQAATGP